MGQLRFELNEALEKNHTQQKAVSSFENDDGGDKSIEGSQNEEIRLGPDGKLTIAQNESFVRSQAEGKLPVTKQSLIMLQQENQALKERVKEVRIILNKEVNDLQDLLKDTKHLNEVEMTRVKVEYGKNLASLNKDYI